ncbi:MFS transporter [Baekduia sp.]|uniref:MFS transporter n=1 Tax=Baekduia sp. TaxID=2600305 RepID=UPI002D787D05|nr:MFS transporter [Baekduia sp.]
MRRSLRVRGFPALATSYAINELGDNLGVVALAILVLDRTDSALAVTALFVAGKFLTAFAAPALTAALDRRRVSRVLPALYVLEAGAFVGLACLARGDVFWLPLVLLLAFADGLLALTARGLSRGAIAAVLMPHDALREGNALINVVFAVMSAAGPVLAGFIVHEWGVPTALWADAASFAIVALLLLLSARSLPEPEPGDPLESWRARVRDGLEYVRGHPTAGRLIAGEAVAILFFALIVPIEVVYAKETLNSTSLGFGVLIAAWGGGILFGSALFARAGGRSLGWLVLVSTAAIGAGYAVMAVSPTLLIACLGSVLGGTGNGVQWVAVMTALQEAVEDQFQARAAGLLESAAAAVPGIGYLVGGALTAVASPRLAYAASAVGVGVVVLVWSRRPIVPEHATVGSSSS